MKQRAAKKVQIAIDKMIDLQSMVVQSEQIQRILDCLNELEHRVNRGTVKSGKIELN